MLATFSSMKAAPGLVSPSCSRNLRCLSLERPAVAEFLDDLLRRAALDPERCLGRTDVEIRPSQRRVTANREPAAASIDRIGLSLHDVSRAWLLAVIAEKPIVRKLRRGLDGGLHLPVASLGNLLANSAATPPFSRLPPAAAFATRQ